GRSPGSHPHYHPYRTPSPHHSPVGSAVGSPNLRARSPDRPQLTPPCQSASYLVPPQDSGWRRTHSDPGIHASVTDPNVIGQTVDGQLSYPSSAMNHMDSSCRFSH
uniref:Uncharacterized protein n=1 Tax=Romanomermis culicivorax TaxID=13658 RepID=A0A915JN96_ROMCU